MKMESFKVVTKDLVKSCYIHIPFCKSICTYCDFCKMYYNEEFVKQYLKALEKEVNSYYEQEVLDTLYIGGGTPSCLSFNNLYELFEIIKRLNLSPLGEFTFECNVEDITLEFLQFLKSKGVNRLSIGVESFNDEFLELLGREYRAKDIRKKILLAKKYFTNINIDLIFGIKGQTLNDIKADLKEFISLDIPHLSIYSLILEDNTKLKIAGYEEISDDESRKMYDYIVSFLKKYNYIHYEISNFSKDGYFSKHNLTYWNNNHYYGFGLGASGYFNNVRYTNTRSITNYIKGNYRYEQVDITKRIDEENFMILGLRKTKGISEKEFYNHYQEKLEEVFDVSKLEYKDGYYYIKEEYLYISNYILQDFVS